MAPRKKNKAKRDKSLVTEYTGSDIELEGQEEEGKLTEGESEEEADEEQ